MHLGYERVFTGKSTLFLNFRKQNDASEGKINADKN